MKDHCTDAMRRRMDESKITSQNIHNNPVEILDEMQNIAHQPASVSFPAINRTRAVSSELIGNMGLTGEQRSDR